MLRFTQVSLNLSAEWKVSYQSPPPPFLKYENVLLELIHAFIAKPDGLLSTYHPELKKEMLNSKINKMDGCIGGALLTVTMTELGL